MERRSRFQLAMAASLLIVLVGCSGEPPQPVPSSTPKPTSATVVNDDILADAGTRGESKADAGPLVAIFEESHDSRVGQIEIAIMLNRLYHRSNLRNMALEGAVLEEATPQAEWFHKLPDENARREVALQLLAQGEISAAEFAAMVFHDFRLHPIEHEEEYKVNLSEDASDAFSNYLLAVAEKLMTNDQISKVNALVGAGKDQEALTLMLESNPWTKDRYERLSRTTPVAIEEMLALAEELESKADEVNADVEEYKQDFQQMKDFFAAAQKRSGTMASETAKASRGYDLIAMDIGAAHTDKIVQQVGQASMSFTVISPLTLSSGKKDGDLYPVAYDRKLAQQSVDPAGVFGSFLDGRRKPRPVLNEEWLQVKSRIMVAGILIARAASQGGAPPFGLTGESLGFEEPDGPINIDLAAMRRTGDDGVLFPVALGTDILWVKVGQVSPPDSLTLDEATLERELKKIKARVEGEGEIDLAKAEGIERRNSSSSPGVVPLSSDVRAVFADTPAAVEGIRLSG